MIRALVLALTLLPLSLHAAAPYLVKDLETTSAPRGSLNQLAWMWPSRGPAVYFVADAGNDAELWTTDGITTRSVVSHPDIDRAEMIGQLGSTVIYSMRQRLYATSGGTPVELGTFSNSSIEGWAIYKNQLYFTATQPATGLEMWKTDGTPGGTTVVDVNPGPASSDPYGFAASGDWLYFFGTTPAGQGLHRTDGTVNGTTKVGSVDSIDPATVSLGNGRIVFFVVDSDVSSSLWTSDGTAGGTSLLRAAFDETERLATPLALLGGTRMIFSAADFSTGDELWITDGTISGTHILHDILPGIESSNPIPGARVGSRYYFAAESDNEGLVLYSTDGTSSGLLKIGSLGGFSSLVAAEVNGKLVFVRRDSVHGSEFWVTDGTAAGTKLLADIHDGPNGSYNGTTFAKLPNALVFRAFDEVHGTEPFITDGTPAGTRLLADIAPDVQFGFNPVHLAWSGSRLFFGSSNSGRIALSDGTEGGTHSILTGSSEARLVEGVTSGPYYFFVTRRDLSNSNVQQTLWRSDGTDGGTITLYQQTTPPYDLELTPFAGGVLFAGYDLSTDLAPWFSNGTPEGTKLVRDLDPSAARVVPIHHAVGSTAWIGSGNTLWRSDGTAAGTVQVGTLSEGGAVIQHIANLGPIVLSTTVSPNALWRGSELVTALPDRAAHLTVVGSLLYFTVGRTMWRSDGTAAGTFALGETDPVVCDPTSLASIGNHVYWLTGTSLWRSDGTTAGTTRVATFTRTGCENALVAHDRRLYFAAETSAAGDELWTSDGTSGGTKLLADLEPGPISSIPRELTVAGNRIFFAATTLDAGRELFAYDVARSGKARAVRH
ncbi:MAG TPA: hypothetical protein VGF48_16445 [Thermoanaerobaculia bacterium]|jgi:ELWxxDGT repeat protein